MRFLSISGLHAVVAFSSCRVQQQMTQVVIVILPELPDTKALILNLPGALRFWSEKHSVCTAYLGCVQACQP